MKVERDYLTLLYLPVGDLDKFIVYLTKLKTTYPGYKSYWIETEYDEDSDACYVLYGIK